jgi:hypothetical protein
VGRRSGEPFFLGTNLDLLGTQPASLSKVAQKYSGKDSYPVIPKLAGSPMQGFGELYSCSIPAYKILPEHFAHKIFWIPYNRAWKQGIALLQLPSIISGSSQSREILLTAETANFLPTKLPKILGEDYDCDQCDSYLKISWDGNKKDLKTGHVTHDRIDAPAFELSSHGNKSHLKMELTLLGTMVTDEPRFHNPEKDFNRNFLWGSRKTLQPLGWTSDFIPMESKNIDSVIYDPITGWIKDLESGQAGILSLKLFSSSQLEKAIGESRYSKKTRDLLG